jgi:hypothetical protein
MNEIIEQAHNVSNHPCHVIRVVASLVALCILEGMVCCDVFVHDNSFIIRVISKHQRP